MFETMTIYDIFTLLSLLLPTKSAAKFTHRSRHPWPSVTDLHLLKKAGCVILGNCCSILTGLPETADIPTRG